MFQSENRCSVTQMINSRSRRNEISSFKYYAGGLSHSEALKQMLRIRTSVLAQLFIPFPLRHVLTCLSIFLFCEVFYLQKEGLSAERLPKIFLSPPLCQAFFTAHQTPWLSPGFRLNWAASEATALFAHMRSQIWTSAVHWEFMQSLTTWSATSFVMWALLLLLRIRMKLCPQAHRLPSWPWSSSRAGQRWGGCIHGRLSLSDMWWAVNRELPELSPNWNVLCFQLRLEALHQIVVLISGMEEKGSQSGNAGRSSGTFHSSSLLTSVRLQFLAGCFGLSTISTGGLKRESVQLHHYQVPGCWLNGNNPPSSFLFSAPSAGFVVAGWNKVSQEEPSNRYPESSP